MGLISDHILNDAQRLGAVRDTGLLDGPTGPDEPLNRFTRLASHAMRAPVALINLLDADRQVSVSCMVPADWRGEREVPLRESFCRHAVTTREPLVIPDARHDPRTAQTDTVRRLGVAAYVGVPLITRDGHALGSLCAVDFTPRTWTDDDVATLREIAISLVVELELRRALRREARAEEYAQQADRERREKSALLESTSEGIYGVDLEGRCTFLNRAAAAVLGWSPEEVQGRNMHQLVHHTREDGTPFPEHECPIRLALVEQRGVNAEEGRFWRRDGTSFPAAYSSAPIFEGGALRGAVVTFQDISDRVGRERTQQFFMEISEALAAAAPDYSATLRALARVAVPTLADWASVYAVSETGAVERVEIVHADPSRAWLARELERYPPEPSSHHPVIRAMGTGEPLLLREIPPRLLEQIARDDEHLRLLRALELRSGMVVPLQARGRTLGALVLAGGAQRAPYGYRDLETARTFAERGALALDSARLFRDAQEANRTKTEFLRTISHELRTPLNAVTGYTALMKEGLPAPLPTASLEYVDRIGRSASHLLGLINEILDFSRLEAEQERVSVAPVSLDHLVEEARAMIEPQATAKGLTLRFHVGPAEELRSDGPKLRRILLNLLDNAVKFTESGEVSLTGGVEGEVLVLRVGDTGVGIASEHASQIFEPFRQVEQGTTRRHGGTGLGLTVADRLARLLGGTISVESTPGRGSTFTVRLPMRTPTPGL